jgi:hypothetical protein
MRCNKSCKFNQNCLRRLPLGDIVSLRSGFWGDINGTAPKVNERRARQVDILLDSYNKHDKTFVLLFDLLMIKLNQRRFVKKRTLLHWGGMIVWTLTK